MTENSPPPRRRRSTIRLSVVRDWTIQLVAPGRGLARKVSLGVALASLAALSLFLKENPCLDVRRPSDRVVERPESPMLRQLMRLEFAGSHERANAVFADWRASCRTPTDATGLDAARRSLGFDYLSILSYVAGLCLLLFLTVAALRTAGIRVLGSALVVLLLLAGVCDVLENLALKGMIDGVAPIWLPGTLPQWITVLPAQLATWLAGALPDAARILSSVKFALVAGVILYLLTAWGQLLRDYLLARAIVASPVAPSTDAASLPTPGTELKGADGEGAELDDVLAAELAHLQHHRHPAKAPERMRRTLVGLALSGGGIRSATTNLGVLQGLAELRILPLVDYLSTVSGGGYIGSCFSTLLSLNGARVWKTPAERPQPRAHIFAPGNCPEFDTSWGRFPFRGDFLARNARRANDLIAHIRTHGNFLIARSGLLRRDAMRAVGNILTGLIYNVSGFVLLLFIVTTLYLAVVTTMAPAMPYWLALFPTVEHSTPSARRPRFVETESEFTRQSTTQCARTPAICVDVATKLRPLGLSHWVQRNITTVADPVVSVFVDANERRNQIVKVLAGALIMGALGAIIALLLVWLNRFLFSRRNLPPPLPGEAYEEAFDKSVLRMLAVFTFGWIVISILTFRYLVPIGSQQLALLWIPIAVLLGARIVSIAIAVIRPQIKQQSISIGLGRLRIVLDIGSWDRSFRSLWGGYQAILIYGLWIAAIFIALAPLMYAFANNRVGASVSGVAAVVAAHLLSPTNPRGNQRRWRLPPKLVNFLLGVAVFLTMGFGMIAIGAVVVRLDPVMNHLVLSMLVALLVVLGLGRLVDNNKLSLHYFYRDRLAETYLLSELPDAERRLWTYRDAMDMPLHELHGDFEWGAGKADRNTAPYHLISAAINLAGSRDLTRKDRKSGYFLFSKLYCGSTHTGFRPTVVYRGGDTKVGRAIAISGAAASSGMGFATFFAQAFATVLFNVRLGYWLENPRYVSSATGKETGIFWPAYLWREVSMTTTENAPLINLSDGGHTGDNVGIYPLLQRRCKVIIACDAEQDQALSFGSLTEALRHAYIDMGISVDIDLSMIRPDAATGRSRSHCAIGRIMYPDRPKQVSYLIYLKNSLTGDEPETVLNYKVASSDFPHETTADQFFDDAQFESYRALGAHIAKATFASWANSQSFSGPEHAHSPDPTRCS